MNNITILEFYADWCGPCKVLSQELKDFKYDITSIDVDNNRDLTKKYGVLSIPTIIIIKNNEEIFRLHGFINKEELENKIDSLRNGVN